MYKLLDLTRLEAIGEHVSFCYVILTHQSAIILSRVFGLRLVESTAAALHQIGIYDRRFGHQCCGPMGV